MNRNRTLVRLAAILVGAMLTSTVSAQSFINEVNTQKKFFDLFATVQTGDDSHVYTVADNGRKLVITDIVATHNVNTTTGVFRLNFRRSTNACETQELLLGPYVGPGETVSVNLSTGLEFLPGESICVVIGGSGANEGISFGMTGWTAPLVNGP